MQQEINHIIRINFCLHNNCRDRALPSNLASSHFTKVQGYEPLNVPGKDICRPTRKSKNNVRVKQSQNKSVELK